MATTKYKVTNVYRGVPVDSDAFTKFAIDLEYMGTGHELKFVQTAECTQYGIGVKPYGALIGFVEPELAKASITLTGVDKDGTQYTASLTFANVATNTEITLETA